MVAGEDDGDEGGIEEKDEEDEELVAIGFGDSFIRGRSYGEERSRIDFFFLRRPTTNQPTSMSNPCFVYILLLFLLFLNWLFFLLSNPYP